MRKDGLLGVGIGAFAVVCCVGFPVLLALIGGAAVSAALGLVAGAAAVIGVLAFARVRRARVPR